MRVRYVKGSKKGLIEEVSRNVAFGLVDSGQAVISKDMIPDDYKQAGDNNGKPTKLRTNKYK